MLTIKGRYIWQNIRLVNYVTEQTKIQNIPGILVQLDFCKAFDTIEWSFIKARFTLQKILGKARVKFAQVAKKS